LSHYFELAVVMKVSAYLAMNGLQPESRRSPPNVWRDSIPIVRDFNG
jgi:hypothetical protein